jgi:subtilisin-like proprotein convertase family protein
LLKVTVTFAKLTHTWPADIDALLESPSLQNALLMANAGGGYALHGVTLAFDADASAYLPQAAQIVSGACKPTAYFPIASFLAPAPSAPYATNLSSLYGGNPNGDWSLFIIDDAAINSGVITNGWSLNVITASPIAPQPLQIGSMVYSNGIFHLTITGPLYSTVIKASTNLINWVPIYTNPVNWMLDYTNLTSSFTFTDPKASNYPTRFYIAVPLP